MFERNFCWCWDFMGLNWVKFILLIQKLQLLWIFSWLPFLKLFECAFKSSRFMWSLRKRKILKRGSGLIELFREHVRDLKNFARGRKLEIFKFFKNLWKLAKKMKKRKQLKQKIIKKEISNVPSLERKFPNKIKFYIFFKCSSKIVFLQYFLKIFFRLRKHFFQLFKYRISHRNFKKKISI